MERGGEQGNGVRQSESGDDREKPPPPEEGNYEAKQEQEMIGAAQDVLNPEFDETCGCVFVIRACETDLTA